MPLLMACGGGTPPTAGDAATAGGDSAAAWAIGVIDDQPGFKSRAALALDAQGVAHVAYNVASSQDGWSTPDIWYATGGGATWTSGRAQAAGGYSNEFPVLALDGARVYLIYNRYVAAQDQVDLFFTWTDGGTEFVPPLNLTESAGHDEFAPVAVVADGVVHLLYQRRAVGAFPSASVGYGQIVAGLAGVQQVLAPDSTPFSLSPDYNLAAASGGVVHAVACAPGGVGNCVLTYRVREGGSWSRARPLTEPDQDVWSPALGLDAAGDLHLAYTKGPDWDARPLWYGRLVAGGDFEQQQLDAASDCRSYFSALAVRPDGHVHLLYRVFDAEANADLYYRHGRDGVFEPVERITVTIGMDEDVPSLVLDAAGRPFVTFVENMANAPDGVLYWAWRR